MLTAAVRRAAAAWIAPVDAGDDLDRAVRYLDLPVSAPTILAASRTAAAGLVGLSLVIAVAVPPAVALPVLLAGVALSAATVYAGRSVPLLAATARRARALGEAPALVSRAVLRLRVAPTPEDAASFAARGEGPLAASLAEHVRRARGTPHSGFDSFADEWRPRLPALAESVTLLSLAAATPSDRRERVLDRARRTALDGTRDTMASFASDLTAPATALYAFGVLLPLALAGLLPAVNAAGVVLTLAPFVVVYDVLLPLALLGASAWLLARRPVAFRPVPVPDDHPSVPDDSRRAVAAGVATAVGCWLFVPVVLPQWGRWLAAVGAGLGTGLVVRYRPSRAVRAEVRATESGLPDVLSTVGRHVADGGAVESGLARAADIPGPAGDLVVRTDERRRRLGVGVRRAFLGPNGTLSTLPSSRLHDAAELLAHAAREGRPAGDALESMADHLDDLRSVEQEARRDVARVTGTLSNTAAVFAPLVAGATVALSGSVGATPSGPTPLPTPALGIAVGCYVLWLAAVLSVLSTGLGRGLDRAVVGYRAGVALLAATAVYLTSFALVSTLL